MRAWNDGREPMVATARKAVSDTLRYDTLKSSYALGTT